MRQLEAYMFASDDADYVVAIIQFPHDNRVKVSRIRGDLFAEVYWVNEDDVYEERVKAIDSILAYEEGEKR